MEIGHKMAAMLNSTTIRIPNILFFESIIEILGSGKMAKFNLRGQSMRPFLHEGDQITLLAINLKNLKTGQIVLAKYQNKYMLHRIVRIKKNKVWLAGDANVSQVEVVFLADLIASVEQVFRKNKEIIVNTLFQRLSGLTWYHIRPLRIVSNKLFGIKNNYK